jgi:hypothetical protein
VDSSSAHDSGGSPVAAVSAIRTTQAADGLAKQLLLDKPTESPPAPTSGSAAIARKPVAVHLRPTPGQGRAGLTWPAQAAPISHAVVELLRSGALPLFAARAPAPAPVKLAYVHNSTTHAASPLDYWTT